MAVVLHEESNRKVMFFIDSCFEVVKCVVIL